MRYFIKLESQEEKEVNKHEYIYHERNAGFRSKFGDEIATASFSGNGISGRVDYTDKKNRYEIISKEETND